MKTITIGREGLRGVYDDFILNSVCTKVLKVIRITHLFCVNGKWHIRFDRVVMNRVGIKIPNVYDYEIIEYSTRAAAIIAEQKALGEIQ
jgi:hypothetical protein